MSKVMVYADVYGLFNDSNAACFAGPCGIPFIGCFLLESNPVDGQATASQLINFIQYIVLVFESWIWGRLECRLI